MEEACNEVMPNRGGGDDKQDSELRLPSIGQCSTPGADGIRKIKQVKPIQYVEMGPGTAPQNLVAFSNKPIPIIKDTTNFDTGLRLDPNLVA